MVRYDISEDSGNPNYLNEALIVMRRTDIQLYLIVAADEDGLCSSRILSLILKSDCIKYEMIIVKSFSELEDSIQKIVDRRLMDKKKSSSADTVGDCTRPSLIFSKKSVFVLLNCGALLDLTRFTGNSTPHNFSNEIAGDSVGENQQSVYSNDNLFLVFDSHRPIHPENFYEKSGSVVVFDDDISAETPPHPDDDENGQENHHPPSKKSRLSSSSSLTDIPSSGGSRRRQKPDEFYFRGNYYSTPVTLSMYQLALTCQYHNTELLWLVCVAISAYYENGYVSMEQYLSLVHDIDQKYLQDVGEQEDNAEIENSNNNGNRSSTTSRPLKSSRVMDTIELVESLRFPLYRHWTLFNSMIHSSYIYGKLDLNKEHQGKRIIQQLLAYAGIPPDQYNQLYCSMSFPVKSKISCQQSFVESHGPRKKNHRLSAACKSFGLDDVLQFEFIRSGLRLKPVTSSTSDSCSSMMSFSMPEISSSDFLHILSSSIDEGSRVSPCSWSSALDLLNLSLSHKEFSALTAKAIDCFKQVLIHAKMVLDQRRSKVKDGLRFIKIERPSSPLFCRSAWAIRRLAVFLNEIYKSKNSQKVIPLIVAVMNVTTGRYTCVGVDPDNLRSDFYIRYLTASRFSGVKVDFDNLDTSVVEVSAHDFDQWVSALFGTRDQHGDILSSSSEVDEIDAGQDANLDE